MSVLNNRFTLIKQLGQGSFSTIYSADDKKTNQKVALKIEKPDKSKRILMFEYDVLKQIQGLPNVCEVHEFVESDNGGQNFIVMKLQGKNLATVKKEFGKKFTLEIALDYLLQMLVAIEGVHSKGFIHRDIKPSNFVIGKGANKNLVYIVDFGLAKLHLQNGISIPMRKTADFRGTITYASLNAHIKVDLSRRDDLWSFYFVILDFFNESLPWKNNNNKDEVKIIKIKSLGDPDKHLWSPYIKKYNQIMEIFYYLNSLKYEDKPSYSFIRQKLIEIQTIHRNFMYPNPNLTQPSPLNTLQEMILGKRMHQEGERKMPFMFSWMNQPFQIPQQYARIDEFSESNQQQQQQKQYQQQYYQQQQQQQQLQQQTQQQQDNKQKSSEKKYNEPPQQFESPLYQGFGFLPQNPYIQDPLGISFVANQPYPFYMIPNSQKQILDPFQQQQLLYNQRYSPFNMIIPTSYQFIQQPNISIYPQNLMINNSVQQKQLQQEMVEHQQQQCLEEQNAKGDLQNQQDQEKKQEQVDLNKRRGEGKDLEKNQQKIQQQELGISQNQLKASKEEAKSINKQYEQKVSTSSGSFTQNIRNIFKPFDHISAQREDNQQVIQEMIKQQNYLHQAELEHVNAFEQGGAIQQQEQDHKPLLPKIDMQQIKDIEKQQQQQNNQRKRELKGNLKSIKYPLLVKCSQKKK